MRRDSRGRVWNQNDVMIRGANRKGGDSTVQPGAQQAAKIDPAPGEIDYIRAHGIILDDAYQDEQWGTEADWQCLIDDVIAGARTLDDIGTGDVTQDDLDIAIAACRDRKVID